MNVFHLENATIIPIMSIFLKLCEKKTKLHSYEAEFNYDEWVQHQKCKPDAINTQTNNAAMNGLEIVKLVISIGLDVQEIKLFCVNKKSFEKNHNKSFNQS